MCPLFLQRILQTQRGQRNILDQLFFGGPEVLLPLQHVYSES